MRTAVIVIGDLGRSPRMQYHAVSLAAAGSDVDLIGLEGAPLMPALVSNPRIHVHRLPDRAFADRSERAACAASCTGRLARGVGQAIRLFGILMRIPKPDTIARPESAGVSDAVRRVAGVAPARRAIRDRLAQPLAHDRRGESWRASSRREGDCAQRAAMGEARHRAPRRVEGAGGMAGARVQGESRRRSTIVRATRLRDHRRPMRERCGKGSPRTLSSERCARRSSSVRRAGPPMKISTCCSKRSSAPSGSCRTTATCRRSWRCF